MTVARVCPRLTRFEPRCLVTMATGQPCSLWATGRIPGATRWSAGWGGCSCRWVQFLTQAKRGPCPTFALQPEGVTPTTPPILDHSPLFPECKSCLISGSRGRRYLSHLLCSVTWPSPRPRIITGRREARPTRAHV